MKSVHYKMLRLLLLLFCVVGVNKVILSQVPVPTKAQTNWQQAELVGLYSYDLHVFDGKKYVQKENRILPVPDYNIFNPANLDTDQWLRAAKEAGIKIAILTATHETGFALYQSDVNPFCLKAVKWRDGKGDIVADFVASCKKYGVLPGIYIGIRWNSFLGVHNFKVEGEGPFAENRQRYYIKMCEGMVKELCSKYGELAIVWFDGGAHSPEQGGPDVLPIVSSLQPNAIFYHNLQHADIRWGGSESGIVPYPCFGTFPYPYSHGGSLSESDYYLLKHGDSLGKYYLPAMADAPLRGGAGRHEWFWEKGDEKSIVSIKQLVNMYDNSVGHNASLIIGLTPDTDGLLPRSDVDTLQAFGAFMNKRYVNAVAEWQGNSNNFTLQIPEKVQVNELVIEEDIQFGERVRSFIVEGLIGNKWTSIAEGSCIGHKYIQVFEKPVICKKIRLAIRQSADKPLIKSFKVY